MAYSLQMAPLVKPLLWVGSSKEDLKTFPEGFGGAGVLEVVDDFDGDTYRAVYTVKLQGAVYALHAFQKKSKKRDQDLLARCGTREAAPQAGGRDPRQEKRPGKRRTK